jgi:Aspartyl protease/PDZ domain
MSMRAFLIAFTSITLLSSATRSASGFQGPSPARGILQVFKFQPHADCILLPVTIDGKRFNFAVDTGAQRTVFDLSLRSKLGEPLGSLVANGAVNAEEFKWPAAQLGDTNLISEEQVVCLDLCELRKVSGREIYGILGMDWLQHRAFEIDFDKGSITFLASNLLPPRFLSTGTPIKVEDCQAWVDAEVAGLGHIQFLIDTGCVGQGRLLPEDFAKLTAKKKVRGLGSSEVWGLGQGSATTEVGAIESLKLGDFCHEGPICYSNPDKETRLLGLGIWSRHVVTFDFPNRMLYLRKGERFGESWVYNRSGLRISKKKDFMIIDEVATDSPSTTLGIKTGDILVSVEGKTAADYSIRELYRLLNAVGQTRKLKIRRNQDELEVVLAIPNS